MSLKPTLFIKVLASIACFGVIVGAVYGTMTWAASKADETAIQRQDSLVSLVVSKMQERIAHDQESATVWDDAITKVREGDREWIDANLGSWMHTYFGHDAAFVIGSANDLIYGFSDVDANPEKAYSTVSLKVRDLIEDLRGRLAAGDTSGLSRTMLSIGETDIVSINGSPAIVSIKPIISDSGEIQDIPGKQPLHIALRYLDTDFAQSLGADYLFAEMRFAWARDDAGRRYFPLASRDRIAMGYFSWRPFLPGTAVLQATKPALVLGAVLVAGALAGLVVLLQGRADRLRKSQGELFYLAHHDPLSGLQNRAAFKAEVEKTLATSEAAVLFLDLDRFKQINDTLGHPVGDRLIIDVAARLKSAVSEGAMVARIGGDEFTILVPASTSVVVEQLAEQLIAVIRQPFEIDGQPILIGLSIGIAFSSAGTDARDVMRRADIALYSAKSTGRNRYVIFGAHMEEMVKTRRDLEQDLREALDSRTQIEVHYQPVYAAENSHLMGVEALARWRHPVKGLVQPDIFIPIAEEAGLIDRLGEQILLTALADAKKWPCLSVAVNASAVELRSDTYALRVAAALERANFDPKRLEIEITESAVLGNEDACRRNINSLRQLGVGFALDDFGTGFSSFGRLQQLDVDRIKIDRCFVAGYGTNSNDGIVQAMISLAHAKGLKITAEGIETNEQKAWLCALGCDDLQGYLLSKPVLPEMISDMYNRAQALVIA
jgi:diguanylate cyclase (GGDEF)-like protein